MGSDDTATVVIRPETSADHAAIHQLVAEAFGSEAEALLVRRIRASPEYVPEMALVAVVGRQVVGHVLISHAVIQGDAGDRQISTLAPLAVRPERQRTGIGSALVQRALAIADRRGEPLVVVEGDPRYYGELGFEPAQRYGIELALPEWAPPDAAQVKPLGGFDPDDPTLRGRVIYPAAFDELDDGMTGP